MVEAELGPPAIAGNEPPYAPFVFVGGGASLSTDWLTSGTVAIGYSLVTRFY